MDAPRAALAAGIAHRPPASALAAHHPQRPVLSAADRRAWRFLPQEWPPWQTVYSSLRRWRRDGTWERIPRLLREGLRPRRGREQEPSAGPIGRQAVKTTGVGGPRGFDRGKQVKGRKRHRVVDPEGLVLRAVVHPADIRDRDGVKLVLHAPIRRDFPRLRHVWLESAATGKGKGNDGIEQTLGWTVQIVAHRPRPAKVWVPKDLPPEQIDWSKYLPPPGFRVLPRRWVVERTFAWQSQQRRLSKDYERLCATSEAWISLTMIRLMVRRLARF